MTKINWKIIEKYGKNNRYVKYLGHSFCLRDDGTVEVTSPTIDPRHVTEHCFSDEFCAVDWAEQLEWAYPEA